MSLAGRPAAAKRFCMARAAVVTLPRGVSVVLISMSSLRMLCESDCTAVSSGAAAIGIRRRRKRTASLLFICWNCWLLHGSKTAGNLFCAG